MAREQECRKEPFYSMLRSEDFLPLRLRDGGEWRLPSLAPGEPELVEALLAAGKAMDSIGSEGGMDFFAAAREVAKCLHTHLTGGAFPPYDKNLLTPEECLRLQTTESITEGFAWLNNQERPEDMRRRVRTARMREEIRLRRELVALGAAGEALTKLESGRPLAPKPSEKTEG